MKLGDKIWIEGSTRATIESLEDGKVLLAQRSVSKQHPQSRIVPDGMGD